MNKLTRAVLVGLIFLHAMGTVCAQSGAFKTKHAVKIIVPFSSGGSADAAARILLDKLSELWGQSVIIENKPGGGTSVASAYAAQSMPDGHTLYMGYLLSYATSASLYSKLPYNPVTALKGVSLVVDAPFILSVGTEVNVKNLSEFINFAKKSTRELSYSSTGNGAGPHLATEIFLRQAGIKAIQIPYKGSSEAITSLISNLVEFSFFDAAALGQLKSGRVKPIAVTSLKRWPQLPDVPTISEAGYPGFNITSGGGILVSSKTPPDIIDKLNQDIVKVMTQASVQQRFIDQGFVPLSSTPQEFDTILISQMERIKNLMNDIGLKAE